MSFRLVLKPSSVIEAHIGIDEDGDVQKFFTSECARQMDRFVPRDEGTLAETVVQNGEVTRNVKKRFIIYEMPYARYQYFGIRQDGTRVVMHYTTPGTGPYWDELMWSAKGEDVVQAVQDYVDKRGGK